MNAEERKVKERQDERRRYFAFLDRRIPEIQNQGKPEKPAEGHSGPSYGPVAGRQARRQADSEYAAKRRERVNA